MGRYGPYWKPGRWAKLAPDPARALRCRLWNGAERIYGPGASTNAASS
jgi:hypothetical protein